MNKLAVLLFPPNWSACVSGPHLAAPLLAGAARDCDWNAISWDLTAAYFRCTSATPAREAIIDASARGDAEELDRFYFGWEDQVRENTNRWPDHSFTLLSGFDFDPLSHLPLAAVASDLRHSGTVFEPFYRMHVIPRLMQLAPSVVGITIASRHQVIPTLRLLQLVREALPKSFLVLGGNIVTRLRGSTAFAVLQSHADQIVTYQGEAAFKRTISAINSSATTPPVAATEGDEYIPYSEWPIPHFAGIEFDDFVGIPALPYVSTRGCYWGRCTFCAIPAGWADGGYAGTAPAEFVADQLIRIADETGISKIKFVDEAIAPAKVRRLSPLLSSSTARIEWEAYARLERDWENPAVMDAAYAGGLRKLYLGLEQAPSTNRKILNKNDKGDILRIMAACQQSGIKLHLFCMVGHPGSTVEDAWATTNFLIDHQETIDTADLVGFRLDRGTTVAGVRPVPSPVCDWETSWRYEPTDEGILDQEAVQEIESECQEAIWQTVPRLLHPLYRVVGPWSFSKANVSEPPIAADA
jgi:Radical SAM superfamily